MDHALPFTPVVRLCRCLNLTMLYVLILRYQHLLKANWSFHKCSVNIIDRDPVSFKGHHSLGPHCRNPLAFPPPRTQLMVIALKACPHSYWATSPTYLLHHQGRSCTFQAEWMPRWHRMARVPVSHNSPPVRWLQSQRRVPSICYMWGISWFLQVQKVTFHLLIWCFIVCVCVGAGEWEGEWW